MSKLILSNRHSGITFAIDAPFHSPCDVLNFMDGFSQNDILAKSVLLICSDLNSWESRLNSRAANPTPNHLMTGLDALRDSRLSLESTPLPGERVFDTTLDHNTAATLAYQAYNYITDQN